jgi:hypothetical protein
MLGLMFLLLLPVALMATLIGVTCWPPTDVRLSEADKKVRALEESLGDKAVLARKLEATQAENKELLETLHQLKNGITYR